eukprot:364265-Chlamydomonas_euryale.AAC.3
MSATLYACKQGHAASAQSKGSIREGFIIRANTCRPARAIVALEDAYRGRDRLHSDAAPAPRWMVKDFATQPTALQLQKISAAQKQAHHVIRYGGLGLPVAARVEGEVIQRWPKPRARLHLAFVAAPPPHPQPEPMLWAHRLLDTGKRVKLVVVRWVYGLRFRPELLKASRHKREAASVLAKKVVADR